MKLNTHIFKFGAKKTLYLITGVTATTAVAYRNPNILPEYTDKAKFGLDGIVRSSRAIYTIGSNVIDYKYSVYGLELNSDEYHRELSEVHLRSARRILKLCETNKGFYVKAGQFAAALRQLPQEYSSTLSSLQDKAVPCDFKAIKEVLVRNLGHELSDMFLSFDEKPIAAASIAQVHRAVLKDNQEVAIKVQYPGLEQQMKIDITTMAFLSKSITWIFPEYRFGWMVSEYKRTISSELERDPKLSECTAVQFSKKLDAFSKLSAAERRDIIQLPTWFSIRCFPDDLFAPESSNSTEAHSDALDQMGKARNFVQEAKNSERTAKNFKENKMVRVPHIFWGMTTSQVLTMQFCSGHKVDDVGYLKDAGIDPTKVAKKLMEVFAEMIFVHGFLHGDPHPGNILVAPEGQNSFSLVLLDHGTYKELDEGFRLDYCQMWNALILLDAKKIKILGEKFGVGKYARYFPVIFTGRTIDSKATLGRGMSDTEKKNLKMEAQSLKMEDISSFMESLPPDFLAILRTDGLLKSIISKLGAPQRVRLLAYAKYSVYGLSAKANHESDLTVKAALSRFKSVCSYIQLKMYLDSLELLSQMKDFQKSVLIKFKQLLLGCVRLLTGGYTHRTS